MYELNNVGWSDIVSVVVSRWNRRWMKWKACMVGIFCQEEEFSGGINSSATIAHQQSRIPEAGEWPQEMRQCIASKGQYFEKEKTQDTLEDDSDEGWTSLYFCK